MNAVKIQDIENMCTIKHNNYHKKTEYDEGEKEIISKELNDNIEAEIQDYVNKMIFDAGNRNSDSIKKSRDRYAKKFSEEDNDTILTELNKLIDSIGRRPPNLNKWPKRLHP